MNTMNTAATATVTIALTAAKIEKVCGRSDYKRELLFAGHGAGVLDWQPETVRHIIEREALIADVAAAFGVYPTQHGSGEVWATFDGAVRRVQFAEKTRRAR